MNNFKDSKTGEEFFISHSATSFKRGKVVYKDKLGKEIVNPKTGVKLIPIPKEGDGVPMLGKFSATSMDGQKNIKKHFGSRANKFDTKGAGGEEKAEKLGAFKEQVIERAKEGRI